MFNALDFSQKKWFLKSFNGIRDVENLLSISKEGETLIMKTMSTFFRFTSYDSSKKILSGTYEKHGEVRDITFVVSKSCDSMEAVNTGSQAIRFLKIFAKEIPTETT